MSVSLFFIYRYNTKEKKCGFQEFQGQMKEGEESAGHVGEERKKKKYMASFFLLSSKMMKPQFTTAERAMHSVFTMCRVGGGV